MKLLSKLSIAIAGAGLMALAVADRATSLNMEVTRVGDQKVYYLTESDKHAPVFYGEDDFIPSPDVKFYGRQAGMTKGGDLYVVDSAKNARWVFDSSSMKGLTGDDRSMKDILSSAFGSSATQSTSPSSGLGSMFGGGANADGGTNQSNSDSFASIVGGAGNSNGGLSESDREFFASIFSGGFDSIKGDYKLPEGVTQEQVQSFFSSIFGGGSQTSSGATNYIPTASANPGPDDETAKSVVSMLSSNGIVDSTANKFIKTVLPDGVTEQEVGEFFAKEMGNGIIKNDTAKKFMETVLPGGVTEKEAQEFFAKEYAAGAFGGQAGNFIKEALSDGKVSKEEEEKFFKSFGDGKSFPGIEKGNIPAIVKNLGNGDGKYQLPNGLTVEEVAKFFSSIEGNGSQPSTGSVGIPGTGNPGSTPVDGGSGGIDPTSSPEPKKVPEPSSLIGLLIVGIGAAAGTLKKPKEAKAKP